MSNRQMGLFADAGPECPENSLSNENSVNKPLAFRARPDDLDKYCGHKNLFSKFSFLKASNFPSIIISGPPGTGKTTLAHILAERSGKDIYKFNAVLGGVNDLKKLISRAEEIKQMYKRESIIFIDEIHRFNKAQQDALLPFIEAGSFTLIGATTENPRHSINRALLSRLQTVELGNLEPNDIVDIINNACEKFDIETDDELKQFVASYSGGDARKALNLLEIVEKNPGSTLSDLRPLILENSRNYDKTGDRHYDIISAFIKSMRGSDPDAALLWLAIMLDGGEDPVFIARRLVVFASEDVGNADIQALSLATAGLQAVQNIGMPEARINLAQVTTYLASTVKSNAAYAGINQALEYVRSRSTIDTPNHLKNHHPENRNYKYPHAYPGAFVRQEYAAPGTPKFYEPKDIGHEANIKRRLDGLWRNE